MKGLPAVVGLGLGLLALGPALAPGFVLSYDMVFVPDPGFSRLTFGLTGTLPRNVPSDAFITALAVVLPADLVQKLVLLAIFVMACMSAASLVPSPHTLPRLAAGVAYAWNPFVAERLLLGQWALLLGYAALPWVVVQARKGAGRGLVLALLPAAVGGFAALAISGLTALIVAGCEAPRRAQALRRVIGAVAVLSLPWLVTGWLRPEGVPGHPAAVEAFAARADTPFGTLGSLLMLGGVWNAETVPAGYGVPTVAALWLLVVVSAIVTWIRLARTDLTVGWGLAWAAGAGLGLALLGAFLPGVLRWLIALWPGFAVLRDGQQYVAPLAVLVAVGFGLVVARLRRYVPGLAVTVLPVVLLPTLAWGAAGRLEAVRYPEAWAEARRIIENDPVPGAVLVLPWAAYRGYWWNDHQRVLDPMPRYLTRRVILNDAVTVGRLTIPAEDPRARRLGSGADVDVGKLREAGIRYVVVDAETDAWAGVGAEAVLRDPAVALYRIEGPRHVRDQAAPVILTIFAWTIAIAVIVWSTAITPITLVPRRPRTPARRKAP
jgi:hypothetical protein